MKGITPQGTARRRECGRFVGPLLACLLACTAACSSVDPAVVEYWKASNAAAENGLTMQEFDELSRSGFELVESLEEEDDAWYVLCQMYSNSLAPSIPYERGRALRTRFMERLLRLTAEDAHRQTLLAIDVQYHGRRDPEEVDRERTELFGHLDELARLTGTRRMEVIALLKKITYMLSLDFRVGPLPDRERREVLAWMKELSKRRGDLDGYWRQFVEPNLKLGTAQLRTTRVGSKAPEIAGRDLQGRPLELSRFKDRVVLLVFWGHW